MKKSTENRERERKRGGVIARDDCWFVFSDMYVYIIYVYLLKYKN